MDSFALIIITIMSVICGIAAIAVLVDMYNNHKAEAL